MFFVYVLRDPESHLVRYVGKTNNPERRLKQHLGQKELSIDSHKSRWIKVLISKGLLPYMEVVDQTEDEMDIDGKEMFWIELYKGCGAHLTNMTNGGEGGNTLLDADTRHKHAQNTSNGLLGKKKSASHCARLKQVNTGKKLSDETKIKIGKAVTGEKNGFYGKSHTKETREHLHTLFAGKPKNYSEDQKINMRKNRFKKHGKYWGVSKLTGKNWWRARIFVDKKEINFGIYRTEQEAAIAYNQKVHEFLPSAPLNQIP